MSYYVYILQSLKDRKYYIGSTSNVEARLKFHNAGLQRSTRNRIPFELVLYEKYISKEEALKREKQIKTCKGLLPVALDPPLTDRRRQSCLPNIIQRTLSKYG